jgi:hypothetical protein
LERELPKILVKSHNQPAIRFREFEQSGIRHPGTVLPDPHNIVPSIAQEINDETGKILVR